MGFTAADPSSHNSENTWFTPKWILEGLGKFDLDPCTMSNRPFDTAEKHVCRDTGACGLSTPWFGRVWLNPPYGEEIGPFIDKFIAHRKGVMLVFARMGSPGIQKLISSGAYFFFIRNRVRFIDKDGVMAKYNPGADSCLIFFNREEIINIRKNFKGELLGPVIDYDFLN